MPRVTPRTIPYGRQDISNDDQQAVDRVLHSSHLTQGPAVERFESALAEVTGARYAVAVNSGTAALHAAYAAAGIAPGRSVVTSPLTFVATANASLYLGGSVSFADVDVNSGLLDAAGIDRAADEASALIAPVHYGGSPADMESIRRIADGHDWIVVEDAAHALGATYQSADGQSHRIGSCSHSEMCCFSFHPVKHITTGEGGAITTNDAVLARRLRRFRSHGITREASELQKPEGPWYYEQHELGFNYRLTDLQSALGESQLARLDEFVRRRREHAAAYDEAFARMENIRPLAQPEWARSSYHLYVVRVPAGRRRIVFDALRSSGILVNVHYIPVYRQPYYQALGVRADCPNAEQLYGQILSLPMFPGLTIEDRTYVIEALSRV